MFSVCNFIIKLYFCSIISNHNAGVHVSIMKSFISFSCLIDGEIIFYKCWAVMIH